MNSMGLASARDEIFFQPLVNFVLYLPNKSKKRARRKKYVISSIPWLPTFFPSWLLLGMLLLSHFVFSILFTSCYHFIITEIEERMLTA
jgi:hypothetical protein